MLIHAIVTFCLVVLFWWCGLSLYCLAKAAINGTMVRLRDTLIGRLMEKTGYGTLGVAVLVVAAAVARWVVGMWGV